MQVRLYLKLCSDQHSNVKKLADPHFHYCVKTNGFSKEMFMFLGIKNTFQ